VRTRATRTNNTTPAAAMTAARVNATEAGTTALCSATAAMAMTVVITPTGTSSLRSRSTMVSQCLTREGKGVAKSRGQTTRRQAGLGADLPAMRSGSAVLVTVVVDEGLVAQRTLAHVEDVLAGSMPAQACRR
jgi:hypothetical protein